MANKFKTIAIVCCGLAYLIFVILSFSVHWKLGAAVVALMLMAFGYASKSVAEEEEEKEGETK